MKTQFIDFEGNFGSQDATLQPTAEDFAAFSAYFQARRAENERLIAQARQAASADPPTAEDVNLIKLESTGVAV